MLGLVISELLQTRASPIPYHGGRVPSVLGQKGKLFEFLMRSPCPGWIKALKKLFSTNPLLHASLVE